jgi:hypothetical protein
MDGSPRVFISYSHDSPEYMKTVLGLADKLREDGVDASIDQYVPAPPEGWPRWMTAQIEAADFVLVLCSEIYYQRVSLNAAPGVGLGTLWESSIVYQLLYEEGTISSKFIPVLPQNGKTEHIPVALRGVQRYQAFTESGYEDLYRRLTSQPAVLKPLLGKQKIFSPNNTAGANIPTMSASGEATVSSSRRAAFLLPRDGLQAFVPVVESQWGEQEAVMLLEPDYSEANAMLESLRSRQEVQMAYRTNIAIGVIEDTQHISKNGVDQWKITFRLQKTDFHNSSEFSTTGLTPDDAAVLRAKRILLNEKPAHGRRDMSDMIPEMMIAGQGSTIEITKSSLPTLFQALGGEPKLFLEAAWVLAALELKMSGAVEQITRLDLTLQGKGLQVAFEGRRHKQYSNQPAFQYSVSGVCHL